MTGDYRIGVDVGGTFTDCVLRRPDGTLAMDKVPTTPDDQSEGVLGGIARLADAEGLSVGDLLARTRTIVHGTTTADNSMIQMTGAATGLIVTRGFRDEIEFRRSTRRTSGIRRCRPPNRSPGAECAWKWTNDSPPRVRSTHHSTRSRCAKPRPDCAPSE